MEAIKTMWKIMKKISGHERGLCITENVFQICIALMPVLYLLNVPILDISLGTVILFVFLPYSALFVWNWFKNERITIKKCIPFLPFAVFYIYLMTRSDGHITHMVLAIVTFIHICGMICGSVKTDKIRKIVVCYAMANVGLVLIQTIGYYIFNVHIQYIPMLLVHEQFQGSYVFRELSGLYRPSALFLEPSHFAAYCCFAIICLLFPRNGKPNLQKAFLVAAGCLLTTSGMGMALAAMIFLWYFIFCFLLSGKIKNYTRKQILIYVVITIIGIVLVCQISFVKVALLRVFSTVDGYNAIVGRLGLWKLKDAIGTMQPGALLCGYGYGTKYGYYLTGLIDTIYKFGLVGVLLELSCFAYLMYKERTHYVWCACVSFFALFTIAHLTAFFVQIFYFGLAIAEIEFYGNLAEKSSNRTELKNDEIKQVCLQILSDVAEFCEKNGIQYFLVCGTALGAIRHNGFIPWDDDVDIGMPRPDYDRFVDLYKSEKYIVCDTRYDRKYPYGFAKVCDNRTILIENVENPFNLGVYIDIFPIDGLPDNEELQKKHMKIINWDLRLLSWKCISHDKKVGWLHKVIQLLAKAVLFVVPVHVLVRKLEYDVKKYSYRDANYVGHLVTKAMWGSDIKPKELFSFPIKHKFEECEFFVPGQVEAYLTQEYGDYMKLPPKEKQIAKHDYVAYWKN